VFLSDITIDRSGGTKKPFSLVKIPSKTNI
jgi:hypothetical protein